MERIITNNMIMKRMNIIKYKKKKPEAFKYLVVGGCTTAISYFLFVVCDWLGKSTLFSQNFSFFFSVTIAYILNKVFVFENKNWSVFNILKEFSIFVFARIFSFVAETIFILVTVDKFGMNSLLSKFIATIFVIVCNYFVSKKIVFKKNKA